MNLSPETREFLHNLAYFFKNAAWLTLIGLALAGLLCLGLPYLIPSITAAIVIIPVGVTFITMALTSFLQDWALLTGFLAFCGSSAGVLALAATASAASAIVLPLLAVLSYTLLIAMLLSFLDTLSYINQREQAAAALAANQEQRHDGEEVHHDLVMQPAPVPRSSAQVSQLLGIQVGMNAGNNGEVAVSLSPQQRVPAVEEEKVSEEQPGKVFTFQQ